MNVYTGNKVYFKDHDRQELEARAASNAARAADEAARLDRLAEDRAVLAGLVALTEDLKRDKRYIQSLGLLVPAAVDGETEVARAYRALDAIERAAGKLSPMVPAAGLALVRETVNYLRLHLNIASLTHGL